MNRWVGVGLCAMGLLGGCKQRPTSAQGGLGQVVCWGLGQSGQIGTSDRTSSTQPVTVAGLPKVDALSAGSSSSCARGAAGLLCWGEAGGGETPARPSQIDDATELGFGSLHTCALRASGQVACWGMNLVGQLGNGKAPDPKTRVALRVSDKAVEAAEQLPAGASSRTAVPVTGLSDVVQIASGRSHTCARRRGGQVVCWGTNQLGQLGSSRPIESSDHPVPVVPAAGDLSDATDLRGGANYTCARRAAGGLWCWGSLSDPYGGSPVISKQPVEIPGLAAASSFSVQDTAACAVRADGSVLCWSEKSPPTQAPEVGPARQVVSGMRHTCALLKTGQVTCWGEDYEGVLGVSSEQRGMHHAVPIPELDRVVELAAGARHSCARREVEGAAPAQPGR